MFDTLPLWLPPVFLVVALVYATAGLGGGSSYLALLALAGVSYRGIPETALACNLVVSAGGVWHFYRGGHFRSRHVLPFGVTAVPMAYLGGRHPVGERAFLLVLGVTLVAAGIRLWIRVGRKRTRREQSAGSANGRRWLPWVVGIPMGAGLGFLAGVVGIGGGVFLAPALILMGRAEVRSAAAATAVFVFANSAAGMAGHMTRGLYLDVSVVPILLAVLIGGQLGSRLGAYKIQPDRVRQVVGVIIMVVGVRVVWKVLSG